MHRCFFLANVEHTCVVCCHGWRVLVRFVLARCTVRPQTIGSVRGCLAISHASALASMNWQAYPLRTALARRCSRRHSSAVFNLTCTRNPSSSAPTPPTVIHAQLKRKIACELPRGIPHHHLPRRSIIQTSNLSLRVAPARCCSPPTLGPFERGSGSCLQYIHICHPGHVMQELVSVLSEDRFDGIILLG